MSGPDRPGQPGPSEQPPDDMEDADPALARERTELAWTRSAIAFAALGGLILKFRPLIGVPVLLFSAVIWWIGHLPRDQAGTASRRVLLVTAAVFAMAVLSLALVVLGHGSRGLRLEGLPVPRVKEGLMMRSANVQVACLRSGSDHTRRGSMGEPGRGQDLG